MRLNGEQRAMLAGEFGPARQWAIRHQIAVGEFFDAPDLVPVGQAHIMADTEATGRAGSCCSSNWPPCPRPSGRSAFRPSPIRAASISRPISRLKQTDAMADIEARAIAAFEALGVLMTNTCINYQTILPPVRGEHLAMGDTGVVIYSNSVMGARSNFEGGPSALAAGLTGRTPRYGYHLDEHRAWDEAFRRLAYSRAIRRLGRARRHRRQRTNSYWEVPVVTGIAVRPNSDELKHFGAALASFGSVALFHMPGMTPEAPTWPRRSAGGAVPAPSPIGARRLRRLLCVLRGDGRQGRRGRVRRAAALADRDAAGRSAVRRAGASTTRRR